MMHYFLYYFTLVFFAKCIEKIGRKIKYWNSFREQTFVDSPVRVFRIQLNKMVG